MGDIEFSGKLYTGLNIMAKIAQHRSLVNTTLQALLILQGSIYPYSKLSFKEKISNQIQSFPLTL